MTLATTPIGPALDAWFERLDGEGFDIGVRERLVVESFFAGLAAQGELPASTAEALALATPLLCTQPQQQRRYQDMLDEFAAARPSLTEPVPKMAARAPQALRRSRALAPGIASVVALVAVLAFVPQWSSLWGDEAQDYPTTTAKSPPAGIASTAPGPEPVAPPIYVPRGTLPIQAKAPPAWSKPLRWSLIVAGALSAALLAAWGIARRRRQLYLHGIRSDEEVEQHLLHDSDPVSVAPHPSLTGSVSRGLRQRMTADTAVLDVPATLHATMSAGGALAPRYRMLKRTPEYVALVDRRHASDHHAAYAETLIDTLQQAGVVLQVFHFEGSPESGCWPRGVAIAHEQGDASAPRRVSFSEIAARHAGHRLLMFAEADAALTAHAETQRWSKALSSFPQRAWFTPLPVHAWGAAETGADALGFLVLPLQAPSLATLSGWLASERLGLTVDADTPLAYPEMLRHEGLAWVTRAHAPPPEMLDELLFQLRAALGAQRFQWLCACAIFPAITPPLTLALGREIVPDARALALGLAALSALPWFRYGTMPAWLREALIGKLSAQHEQRLREVVEQRLARSLDDGTGPTLTTLAIRRRLKSWLHRARGPARDLVMVGFLQRGLVTRLAQRLPEVLRKRLFRHGLAAHGLRPWPITTACVLTLGALFASSGLWSAWTAANAPPLASLASVDPAYLSDEPGVPASLLSISFADDRIANVGSANGFLGHLDLKTGKRGSNVLIKLGLAPSPSLVTTPEGFTLFVGSDGLVHVTNPRGQPVGAPMGPTGVRLTSVALAPGGRRVAAIGNDGRVHVWGAPWRARIELVGCDTTSGAPSALADALAADAIGQGIEIAAYTAKAWSGLHDGKVPDAGQIRYHVDASPALLPKQLQAWLQSRAGAGPITWRTLPSKQDEGAIVASVCGQVQKQSTPPASPIEAAVSRMFDDDATVRSQATTQIAFDPEALSDAVPIAMARAIEARSSRTPSEAQIAGVINTLTLLKVALPATVNRSDPMAIQALLLFADQHGHSSDADALRAVIKRTSAVQPQVFLRLWGGDPAAEAAVEKVAVALRKRGMAARTVDNTDARAPASARIDVAGASDRPLARELRDLVAKELATRATLVATPRKVSNDSYDIWFDAGLCKRLPSGCQADAANAAVNNFSPPQSADAMVECRSGSGYASGDDRIADAKVEPSRPPTSIVHASYSYDAKLHPQPVFMRVLAYSGGRVVASGVERLASPQGMAHVTVRATSTAVSDFVELTLCTEGRAVRVEQPPIRQSWRVEGAAKS